MSVRHAAVLEKTLLVKTLRSALESYRFQFNTMTALFIISGAVVFVATWRGRFFLCHMAPPVPTDQKCNLLSDPVFHQEDLFAPATLDTAQHAAGDVSLS